jgi:hypothetical protein
LVIKIAKLIVAHLEFDTMTIRSAVPAPTPGVTYEPRPQKDAVDYAALGQLTIKRFPKVLAELAK